jgi:hypothetical protein
MLASNCACVRITPFGCPVLPEVYCSIATSSAPIGSASNDVSPPLARPSGVTAVWSELAWPRSNLTTGCASAGATSSFACALSSICA